MSNPMYHYQKAGFQGDVMQTPRDYSPMKVTNLHTGKLEEVVLISPHQLQDRIVVEDHSELRLDLKRALKPFTTVQRRVLYRVLVQGQSIETASKGLSKTQRWWSGWLQGTALPKLRAALGNYVEGGKLVIG